MFYTNKDIVRLYRNIKMETGVSASHLDWTLVPYVRKSFSKHMKDGLRYVEKITDENYINSIPKELSFDNEYAKTHKESYKYAMDMTKKEVYQAVEGFCHNMNSLQSRSGNQLRKLADAIVR